jgi:hypothetical protein
LNQIFYLKPNLGLENPSSFDSKTIKHFFIRQQNSQVLNLILNKKFDSKTFQKPFLLNSKHLFSVKNSTQNFFLNTQCHI